MKIVKIISVRNPHPLTKWKTRIINADVNTGNQEMNKNIFILVLLSSNRPRCNITDETVTKFNILTKIHHPKATI
jgi:hypothetical protein